MNPTKTPHRWLSTICALLVIATLSVSLNDCLAHGSDDHKHEGASPSTYQAQKSPHVEASSERFEILAIFNQGELRIYVDDFRTNEPIFIVTDEALVKKLNQAGEHQLIFKIVAEAESDLLAGTLLGHSEQLEGVNTPPPQNLSLYGYITLALLALGFFLFILRRKKQRPQMDLLEKHGKEA
ncbi:MAG: hypothetical protein EBS62_13405 [Betaproteobacteria bacterium]|nr:hypothetical protein [Betaproteobacteria bacterium]